jgi:hypothetical protein
MKSIRQIQTWAAVLLFFIALGMVQADIGVVRLREVRGPFVITVFTGSELVRGTASDVSVMVQRRDSSEPILDATVNLVFTAPSGADLEHGGPLCGLPGVTLLSGTAGSPTRQVVLSARRDQSSNKLLYAVPVNWPLAGCWNLETSVRQGPDSAKVACELAVGLPTRQLTRLLPYLALPLLLVALFATNQWLRCHLSERQ